ncbi:MAG TPA: FtsQ-type POTRA domain-containing protein [Terriglobales bacterium]|nr:FtsQ-type POTRA domain-containing protein [Terriglobales bacterium]
MARKSSPTIVQEELYPPPGEPERELDDARLVDLDAEEESPFLRGQKRVSARRTTVPKKTLYLLAWSAVALVAACVAGIAGTALYQYGERNWRFRIQSSDDILITGTHNVPHAQVMEVLGGDIGRNIFFIPLAERKAQLEKIPWVESASVMRFVPNRLQVEIHERTPVAFARVGSRIWLIDAGGTLMELPGAGKQKYSFPVVVGMNPGEPLSTRAARMKSYNQLLREFDSDGGHYSQDLSEVDLSDQEDIKVLTNDSAGPVLVHLGPSDFLSCYKTYVTHVQGWRQQFDKLESVDLRYEHQIIVNPDSQGGAKVPQITPAVAKAAMAAGVKPAALIHVASRKPGEKPAAPVKAIKTSTPEKSASTAAKAVAAPAVAKHPTPAPQPAKGAASASTTAPAKQATQKSKHRRVKAKAHSHKAKAKSATPSTAKGASTTTTAATKPELAPKTNASLKRDEGTKSPSAAKAKPKAAITKKTDQQDHP